MPDIVEQDERVGEDRAGGVMRLIVRAIVAATVITYPASSRKPN